MMDGPCKTQTILTPPDAYLAGMQVKPCLKKHWILQAVFSAGLPATSEVIFANGCSDMSNQICLSLRHFPVLRLLLCPQDDKCLPNGSKKGKQPGMLLIHAMEYLSARPEMSHADSRSCTDISGKLPASLHLHTTCS